MAKSKSSALTITTQASNLPDSLRGIQSITDLFNLQAGDYVSVMEFDLEADGWPELADIENDDALEEIEYWLDQIDVNDINSINNFASDALADLEQMYRMFRPNELVNSRIATLRRASANSDFDFEALEEKIRPLTEQDEDQNQSWWSKLWGDAPKEKMTSEEVKSLLASVEQDLNAQTASLHEVQVNAERLHKILIGQKEDLQRAADNIQTAEARLFLAYAAGRKILTEWYSDEVTSSYIGLTPFDTVEDYMQPDTEFYTPATPRDWAEQTFALDSRLMRFRNVYLNSQEQLSNVPERQAEIDRFLEEFNASQALNLETWQKTAKNVRNMVEFVRAEQRIEDLMERSRKLAERRVNHETYMDKAEKSHKQWVNGDGKALKQPTEVYNQIAAQSEKLVEELDTQKQNLEAQYTRLCDISDHYRQQLGQPQIERVDNLIETMESAYKAEKSKTKRRFTFGF